MPGPLISADDLMVALDECTVLDVRWRLGGPSGLEEFEKGHLPGAVFVDLETALAAPARLGGRHPLPSLESFADIMRMAGVDTGRPVVVYDDWGGRAAARCWWLLRHHGHDDVRVLDGGWSAWREAGGPVETHRVLPATGDFVGVAGRSPVLSADEVPAFEGVLVDARDAARFRGESEPVDPVAGHIPGALNRPTGENLRADGTFRPVEELRERYDFEGAPVAAYCGSGVTACHDLLAMAVTGTVGVLYPGSWSEWVQDPQRPVETG